MIHRLGFATTCVILGGQTLAAVRPDTLSLEGGVAIVAVLSVFPCFVGYELLHRYERYVWAPILLVMLFLWGLGGKAGYHVTAQKAFEDPAGRFLAGDVLSFGGIVFGSFTGVSVVFSLYSRPSTLTCSTSGLLWQQITTVNSRSILPHGRCSS